MFEITFIPSAAGSILAIFILYKYLIYPTYISPLAKIPNAHFTSSISSAWILWTRLRCQENRDVFAAHQRYGPVVRLGPNELSINCVDGGIRTVYGGGFEKGEWYSFFRNYGYVDSSRIGEYRSLSASESAICSRRSIRNHTPHESE